VDSKRLGNIWNPHTEREFSSIRYATFCVIYSNFKGIVSRGMRNLASINKSLIYSIPSTSKESQPWIFTLSILDTTSPVIFNRTMPTMTPK
jgi:hypothetical protein